MPVDGNPIDQIWTDRPAPPLAKIEIHPIEYAGELARDRLARLAAALAKDGAAHAVLTDTSSVAWAFNIRGSDVPHTPVALAFAVLSAEGPHLLFIDKRKLRIETEAYLTQLADLRPPSALDAELRAACRRRRQDRARPGACRRASARRWSRRAAARSVELADPARLPRATKNQTEIAGARAAHRRDGAAVAKMLGLARPPGAGSHRRDHARRRSSRSSAALTGEETQMPLRDVSFDTIAGAGPNGAIMHYRVSRGTNRKLEAGELFLLDSGAQYQDGTTDITRTVAVGQPTDEMRERYTIVLKGMVGISMLRFPAGTRGADIDAVARLAPVEGRASTTPMAPAMASAPICRCTKGRSASPRPAPSGCSPA